MAAGEIIRARRGEPVDSVVWRTVGGGAAAVQATLEANPGLAALGPALPADHPVFVPDAAAERTQTAELIQLWDA